MRSSNVQLLALKEQISTNLSSHCLAQTLDDLLAKFIKPVLLNTNYLEATIVELIVHVFTDSRRKFSSMDKQELQNHLFSFLVCENPDKQKLLRDARIERSVYFKVLNQFIVFNSDYQKELPKALKSLKPTEKMIELKQKAMFKNDNIYITLSTIMFWSTHIYNFRNMIVEKFIRLAKVEANKASSDTALNISRDDLFRGLIESIHKAIDKYDAASGTLTKYVQHWFMDAKTNQNYHEEGVAYSIPTQIRRKLLNSGIVNIAQTINEEKAQQVLTSSSISDTIEEEEEHSVIANLVCRSDSDKIFSILSGIRYNLTLQDIEIQKETLQGHHERTV